jgi:hypothetical protein
MKLKTNKTSIKGPKPKIRNQKNKDWSWNINNQEGQAIIFKGEEREGKKIFIYAKLDHHQWHALYQKKKNMTTLPTTWRKDIFGRCMHRLKGANTSHTLPSALHTHPPFRFFIYPNTKLSLRWLCNYKKKKFHYKKLKTPLISRFKIFYFKGISVVSTWILIVYYFLYLFKY